jgi:2-isopropylmalate synthase
MTHQEWNAEQYQEQAGFVPALGQPVLDLLAPRARENILDLGCGDGTLSLEIQKMGCRVTGIDDSAEMATAARAKGIHAVQMDAHQLNYSAQFEAVFSNAALHWMTHPEKVLRGVHRALKPGGRFVGEMGAQGNIAWVVQAMREVFEQHPQFGAYQNPWFFPSVSEYQTLLEQAGFQVPYIERIPRPTPLTSDLQTWLELFSGAITAHLTDEHKQIFYRQVSQKLQPHLYTDENGWVVDYVRLRFKAVKG